MLEIQLLDARPRHAHAREPGLQCHAHAGLRKQPAKRRLGHLARKSRVAADRRVELAGEAADGGFVSKVGRREAAGGHAANMAIERDEDGGLAAAGSCDRGCDAARCAAIHDDVGRQCPCFGQGCRLMIRAWCLRCRG